MVCGSPCLLPQQVSLTRTPRSQPVTDFTGLAHMAQLGPTESQFVSRVGNYQLANWVLRLWHLIQSCAPSLGREWFDTAPPAVSLISPRRATTINIIHAH